MHVQLLADVTLPGLPHPTGQIRLILRFIPQVTSAQVQGRSFASCALHARDRKEKQLLHVRACDSGQCIVMMSR